MRHILYARRVDLIVMLLIFVTGVIIRLINLSYAIHVDETSWITRGYLYPRDSFQSFHPGVTALLLIVTMIFFHPESFDIITFIRIPFCIFGAATCSLVYLMGKSMFDQKRGLFAGLLLTFEPFYIGLTRIIHLDGLLSFFFTLTMYLFWLGINQKKQKYIILSGLSLGFSLLTKSPAIFLFPVLIIWMWLLKRNGELYFQRPIRQLMLIFLIAILTLFILWPGIWNYRRYTVLIYTFWAYGNVIEGHGRPLFFMGSISKVLPPYFYLIILFVRTSPGLLVTFFISIFYFFKYLLSDTRRRQISVNETIILIAIIVFVLGHSVIGKKMDRYLIPIWPLMALFSSNGLSILEDIKNKIELIHNQKPIILNLVFGALVIIPSFYGVIKYQPFYVFYFNDFVGGLEGGSQITVTYSTEGTRYAAEYLSSISSGLKIACAYNPVLFQTFYNGTVKDLPDTLESLWSNYDYVVFHLNWIQRFGYKNNIWQYYANQSPEWVLEVQGQIIIWIFKM